MARKYKSKQTKSPRLAPAVFVAVSVAAGAFGTLGWWLGAGDLWQRLPLAFLAGAAAFVVPVCASFIGRSAASFVLIAPAVLFMGWTAVSTEHGVDVLIEAPRKLEFAKVNAAALDAVKAAEARVALLQAKRDALQPEVVECSPCRNTRADAAKRDAEKLDRADKAIALAQADVDKAKAALPSYAPLVSAEHSLVFGLLLDLVLALAVWGIEATHRAEQRRAQAKVEASRKQRERQNKGKARKATKEGAHPFVSPEEAALLVQTRGPHLRLVR